MATAMGRPQGATIIFRTRVPPDVILLTAVAVLVQVVLVTARTAGTDHSAQVAVREVAQEAGRGAAPTATRPVPAVVVNIEARASL